jgi:hypothetical protein
MAAKTPIKATFTGSDVTGLAEFTAADFIPISDGGTGAVTASDARTNLDVDSKAEVTTKAVNNGITFAIALG